MIWNIDYETFYSKHIKCFKIFAASINDKSFVNLMRACRLKPYAVFEKDFQTGIFHNWWVDEWGNSIVSNKGQLSITLNDSSIQKHTQTKTDLFFGQSILTTINNSQMALLIGNKLVCYGNDEFFRAYELSQTRIAPVIVGFDVLRKIYSPSYVGDDLQVFQLRIKGMKEKLLTTMNQGKSIV